MSIADMHARWRQKASSATQGEKPDHVQRLWPAGGAVGGAGLGATLGGGAGVAWAASRYPWLAEAETTAAHIILDRYNRDLDDLDDLARKGHNGLTGKRVAKQEVIDLLQRGITETEDAVMAGKRRFFSASGLGLGAGVLVGGLGGYAAFKHLARPSE